MPVPPAEAKAAQEGIKRASGRAKKTDPAWEREARAAHVLVACREREYTIDRMRELSNLRPCPSGEERAITAVMNWGVEGGLAINTGRIDRTARKGNHGSPRYIYRSKVTGMDPKLFPLDDHPKKPKHPHEF